MRIGTPTPLLSGFDFGFDTGKGVEMVSGDAASRELAALEGVVDIVAVAIG